MAKHTMSSDAPYTPVVMTTELEEAAKELINHQTGFVIKGVKEGISASVLDDISQIPATTVVPDPGGIQLAIKSSTVNDAAAGTGARTIEIAYLDTAGLEQTETLILNGTTQVDTVATNIDKVNWIHSLTVGSGGVADGNLSLVDKATGIIVYEYIEAGGNASLSARYHVPSDKTGFVKGWICSADTSRADIRLRATVDNFERHIVDGVFIFQDSVMLKDSSSGYIPFEYPLLLPSSSSIKVSAKGAGSGANVGTSIHIILIENTALSL